MVLLFCLSAKQDLILIGLNSFFFKVFLGKVMRNCYKLVPYFFSESSVGCGALSTLIFSVPVRKGIHYLFLHCVLCNDGVWVPV